MARIKNPRLFVIPNFGYTKGGIVFHDGEYISKLLENHHRTHKNYIFKELDAQDLKHILVFEMLDVDGILCCESAYKEILEEFVWDGCTFFSFYPTCDNKVFLSVEGRLIDVVCCLCEFERSNSDFEILKKRISSLEVISIIDANYELFMKVSKIEILNARMSFRNEIIKQYPFSSDFICYVWP